MDFRSENYYVDGEWFTRYGDAKDYAESMMAHDGRYRSVYTKAEIDSQIEHVKECGK
jgi:hypothetical protein